VSRGTRAFYDQLADVYPLLYDDFEAEVTSQGAAIDAVLRSWAPSTAIIADLAAGIGTQAIALARHGWTVHAFDLSPRALVRLDAWARREGVAVSTTVHDFTAGRPGGLPRDCPIAFLLLGNAVAFATDDKLSCGLRDLAADPSTAAVIGSTRVYDPDAIASAPCGACVFEHTRLRGGQSVTHRWFACGGRDYRVEVELAGTVQLSAVTMATARHRSAIAALFLGAGFTSLDWIEPNAAGFYQPMFVAR